MQKRNYNIKKAKPRDKYWDDGVSDIKSLKSQESSKSRTSWLALNHRRKLLSSLDTTKCNDELDTNNLLYKLAKK